MMKFVIFHYFQQRQKAPSQIALSGVQGQLIDRTAETILKKENEKLISLNQEAYESLKEKTQNLKKFLKGLQNIYHLKFIKIFLKQNPNKRTTISEKS